MISALHRQHRAVEFKKFLTAIDKAKPAELDVHLVCDNLATHKTPAIRDWLTKHPRFTLHFTPTGSSSINQVERWFGFLTDQLLKRGVQKSVVALENDVREWIATWNADPRPFAWTKTAEAPSANVLEHAWGGPFFCTRRSSPCSEDLSPGFRPISTRLIQRDCLEREEI